MKKLDEEIVDYFSEVFDALDDSFIIKHDEKVAKGSKTGTKTKEKVVKTKNNKKAATSKKTKSKKKTVKKEAKTDKGQLTIDEMVTEKKELKKGVDESKEVFKEPTKEKIDNVEEVVVEVEVVPDAKPEEIVVVQLGESEKSNEKGFSNLTDLKVDSNIEAVAKMNEQLPFGTNSFPYVAQENIMTQAEKKLYTIMNQEFNRVLRCIGKYVYVFPKIRLADLVKVRDEFDYDKHNLYKIACKHVDYVVCDCEDFKVICAVELDDFYHELPEKIERDKFVNETLRYSGIQLFRIKDPIKYVNSNSLSDITDYILDYYSPTCPKCGKVMRPQKSRRRKNYGHRFYGCIGWRSDGRGCNCTIDID